MTFAGKEFREASLFEAVEFMATRKMVRSHDNRHEPAFAIFEDGSWVGFESRWSGPYSELTPDIDARPPVFYIYEAKGESSA